MTETQISLTQEAKGEAWASWTPTLTNLSGGTLNYAKYIQIGKTVFYRFKYTLGASGGVAGDIYITLPVQEHADYVQVAYELMGQAMLRDTGTSGFLAGVYWAESGKIRMRASADGTSGYIQQVTNLSSTVPFTWANTDQIYISGSYEAA